MNYYSPQITNKEGYREESKRGCSSEPNAHHKETDEDKEGSRKRDYSISE
jgi:hypothetical protein